MRDVNIKPVIIFALNKATRLDDLKECWSEGLKNIVPLLGVYNNVSENSYLVEDTEKNFKAVYTLAKRYNQESILTLDQDRNAVLEYLDSNLKKPIGKLRAITRDEALTLNAWSYNEYTDTYYSVL